MKTIKVIIFLLSAYLGSLHAQENVKNIEQIIADIFEQYSAESEENIDYESFFEDLMYVAEHPINLNQVKREQLEKLPFLNDNQIDNIQLYVYENAPLQSLFELQLIEGLDMTDIRRMLPFVLLGDIAKKETKIDWKKVLKNGKNEVLTRIDKGLETKEGYQWKENPEENTGEEKKYPGSSFYESLRYRFRYREQVSAGLTAEKDAGEQFWGSKHKGFDFYSAHFQVSNWGKINTIIVGDYRVNFGQGLVIKNDAGSNKSSYVLNVVSRKSGIKSFSSTDEINFLRGSAINFDYKKQNISLFYSLKKIDGDTIGGVFKTIYNTGLHRTEEEWSKKETVVQQVMGGNINYTRPMFQIGITAIHTRFNRDYQMEIKPYNQFYFRGSQQTTGGINYRFRWKKLMVFGETATDNHAAIATINGCTFSPLSLVSMVILQRSYDYKFNNLFANAFSKSSHINNEKGWYIGVETRPFSKWKISFYSDSYRYNWLKYNVDIPSIGYDLLLQTEYYPTKSVSMNWRFRYEASQQNNSNDDETINSIINTYKSSIRYTLSYSWHNFEFKNLLEFNRINKNNSYGYTALQDIFYKCKKIPLIINFRYQFFDAQNYENRFYIYENDVLYAFSIPMLYGLGSRIYLNSQLKLNNHISCWLKIAQTIYADDRENISSGNEAIVGNRKTDLRIMLKYIF